jgi:hypothetical protein
VNHLPPPGRRAVVVIVVVVGAVLVMGHPPRMTPSRGATRL